MTSEANTTSSQDIDSSPDHEQQAAKELEEELRSFILALPESKPWVSEKLHQYKGFWYGRFLLGILAGERQYYQLVDRPPKVIVASYPKSGTTWVKSLLFAIITRTQFDFCNPSTHPLMNCTPNQLIPLLEMYSLNNILNPIHHGPILATHVPFSLLSDTFMKSDFPIVYVYRNPKDVIVSFWHFANKIRSKELVPLDLGQFVNNFCTGHTPYGPYYDHVSQYWDASSQFPKRVLFLSYEDLKKDPIPLIRNLAEFAGCPFSAAEEQQGLVKNIMDLCGFQNLSNLEVNKPGKAAFQDKTNRNYDNSAYFRKGEIGDHKNYMSDAMVEMVDTMIKQKLKHIMLN